MTRYELLDRIGLGGMAEIFRGKAVAAGGFEKPVAIKRILPHLSQDKRFVELLIAEAQILSHLRHRNIVQIYDVGLGDDGQYFLVMEYVDGADLRALFEGLEARRKRLPLSVSLHIGAEVCEALAHAHAARGPDGAVLGLVHRDVSPSNILLSRSGEVKLTDFGIAKRPEEATGHGGVRGKFAYISPEQGANQHVDGRSDVFSLGICLFELILGRRLFSDLSDFEALRAVREARIPRMCDVDRSLPGELDALVRRALAPDPDARFASASEFGAALRSLRYAIDESGGDPAKDIARIVNRITQPQGGQREPTVVRIETAAGFPVSQLAATLGTDSFAGARAVLDSMVGDEEEATRAVNRDALRAHMAGPGREGRRDGSTLAVMLGAHPTADFDPRALGGVSPLPEAPPPLAPAATPGRGLAVSVPQGSSDALTASAPPPQHIHRHPRRRINVLLLAGLSALLAVAAFFAADALLARRGGSEPELEVTPGAALDAAGAAGSPSSSPRGSAKPR